MKSLLLLCLSIFSFSAIGQNLLPLYNPQKVSEHVYVIHGPTETPNEKNRGFMNNPAFIIGEHSVVVVDPGSSDETGQMVLDAIKQVTDKPVSHIFNTHIHGDHWLGNEVIKQAYPDVVIIADPRMLKKAQAGEAQSWQALLKKLTKGATKNTKIALPNKLLSDGDSIQIDNLKFNIVSVGIAHSDSDIMIVLLNDSLMFTGDNVAYKRIVRLDDGSFRDNIKACDKAISMNLKHYVPGHGPTGDVSIVKAQRDYLNILYTEVKKYYDEGLSDFEMKPKILPSLSAYKDWPGFDHEVGKHISLAVLEAEKAEFE